MICESKAKFIKKEKIFSALLLERWQYNKSIMLEYQTKTEDVSKRFFIDIYDENGKLKKVPKYFHRRDVAVLLHGVEEVVFSTYLYRGTKYYRDSRDGYGKESDQYVVRELSRMLKISEDDARKMFDDSPH